MGRRLVDFVTCAHLSISHRVDIFSFTACRVDIVPTFGYMWYSTAESLKLRRLATIISVRRHAYM